MKRRFPTRRITGIDRDASALASHAAVSGRDVHRGRPQPSRWPSGASTSWSASARCRWELDDRTLLRRIVDHAGAVIFGIPNCRYLDGEQRSGARMKNFRQPELGLLVKDVAFYRKYLQQHDREVWVTGKSYLLVTARNR